MIERHEMGDLAVELRDNRELVISFARWAFEHRFKREEDERQIQEAAPWFLNMECVNPGFAGDVPAGVFEVQRPKDR